MQINGDHVYDHAGQIQTVFKFVLAKASCLIYDYLFKSNNIFIYFINNMQYVRIIL